MSIFASKRKKEKFSSWAKAPFNYSINPQAKAMWQFMIKLVTKAALKCEQLFLSTLKLITKLRTE